MLSLDQAAEKQVPQFPFSQHVLFQVDFRPAPLSSFARFLTLGQGQYGFPGTFPFLSWCVKTRPLLVFGLRPKSRTNHSVSARASQCQR